MMPFAPRRPVGCLSDLALDRLRAGESLPEASAHAAGCDRCGPRLVAPRHFEAPMPDFAGRLRSRRRVTWGAVAGALAAAAVLILVLRPPDGKLRVKGGAPSLGYFVKRGEHVLRGAPEEPIHPGDRLRFVVSSDRPRHVAILSLDGAGRASVYSPPVAIAPGSDQPLPGATLLDEVVGRERLYAVFCDAAFDAEPLRVALEQGRDLAAEGCEVETLSVDKTR